jgi:long-subunit fatty acid transport protein
MKSKFMLAFLLAGNLSLFSQVLSYSDQAVLFSSEDPLGTARFMGMSGAFGALGNDLTSIEINPAAVAVYNGSEFTSSLAYRNTDINSTFYGTTTGIQDDYFRFSQIGGVSAWDNFGNPDIFKFSVGFNYSVIKDYNNNFVAQGNSGVPEFLEDPFLNYDDDPDNDVFYTEVEDQRFSNYTSGINDRFTFSFGTLYKERFYLGASMAFHHINFYQNTEYQEINNDGAGDFLDAFNNQSLSTYGNGFNFGIGTIILPTDNLRIGLAYQSPIWYNLSERFNEYLDIVLSNTSEVYVESYDPNYYDYKLRTPSKFNGSLAYVFGSAGLISFDYSYQNFRNTQLQPSGAFIEENQDLNSGLRNTSTFKVGTEWNFNIISLRGGYRLVQSPYRDAGSSFDLNGYSLGLGIRFSRNFGLDFAYDQSSYDDQYRFLNIPGVEPARLEVNNSRFISTLLLSF